MERERRRQRETHEEAEGEQKPPTGKRVQEEKTPWNAKPQSDIMKQEEVSMYKGRTSCIICWAWGSSASPQLNPQ